MQELIWFSIPGFVMAATIIAIWPSTIDSEPKTVLWIVLLPVMGFIVHQLFRLIFEVTGGFARKSRKVLHHISKVLALRENIPIPNLQQAFLVWEAVFYSEEFPAAFRDHDRNAWHFILSFWSVSISAIIAFILCLIGYFFISPDNNFLGIACGEFSIALIFFLKGRSTYKSLIQQETAIVYNYEKIFLDTLKKLSDMK